MKFIYTILIAALFISTASAQTNTTSSVGSITGNTNVQTVIVDILMGVKNASGEIYDVSKSAISSGIDVVKSQAPDIITEFLKWKFTCALIFVIMGLILIVAGGSVIFYCLFYCYKKPDIFYDTEVLILASIFLGGLPIVTGTALTLVNIFPLVQIWIAPKIYLIEYIVSVVKTH